MISQELIDELKTIIKEDYKVDLQPTVVSDIAYTLVGFFETLAKVAYETGIVIPPPEIPITDLKQKLKGGDEDDQKGY